MLRSVSYRSGRTPHNRQQFLRQPFRPTLEQAVVAFEGNVRNPNISDAHKRKLGLVVEDAIVTEGIVPRHVAKKAIEMAVVVVG